MCLVLEVFNSAACFSPTRRHLNHENLCRATETCVAIKCMTRDEWGWISLSHSSSYAPGALDNNEKSFLEDPPTDVRFISDAFWYHNHAHFSSLEKIPHEPEPNDGENKSRICHRIFPRIKSRGNCKRLNEMLQAMINLEKPFTEKLTIASLPSRIVAGTMRATELRLLCQSKEKSLPEKYIS